VATVVVLDDPELAGGFVVAGMEDAVVGDVGEGHRPGGDDNDEARNAENAENTAADRSPTGPLTINGAGSKGHSRSFAHTPRQLGFSRPGLGLPRSTLA
jgi:hypothetical protein